MKALRAVSTVVTSTALLAGGLVLLLAGHPLVSVLGAATAVVGVGYGWAGLRAEALVRGTAPPAGLGDRQAAAGGDALALAADDGIERAHAVLRSAAAEQRG